MERNFYTDDFERLLKERSDEFRMYPSKRVWHSIYNDLHPGRKWPSVAVSLLLIAALFITGYWNSNNHTTAPIIASSNNLQTGIVKSGSNTTVLIEQTGISNSDKNIDNHNTNNASGNSGIASLKQNTATHSTNPESLTANTLNRKAVSEKRASASIIDYSRNTLATQNSAPVSSGQTKHVSENTGADMISKSGNPASVTDKNSSNTTGLPDGGNSLSSVVNTKVEIDLTAVNKPAATENNTDAVMSANTTDKVIEAPFVDPSAQSGTDKKNEAAVVPAGTVTKTKAAGHPIVSAQDKAWMDDYAFYNRSTRKKWKDRVAKEFYITPSVGFRNFSNNSSFDAATVSNAVTVPFNTNNLNTDLHQKPGLGVEAGIGLVYKLSKKISVKTGIQANYTSYTIYGEETNHPVLTTLRLTNINTGFPYLDPRTATLANSGLNTAKVHNNTYQVSIPLGLAIKLAGTDKLEWYAGASIQPSFMVSGKANMISDDRKNYVADPGLLRRWNLNSGFETYIHYKLNGFTLQAGPQFRYQLLSTYSSQYTTNENLYNIGLKIGIIKNF